MASHKITLSQSNWTGGTAAIYFDDVSQLFYADSDLTSQITEITPPTRELYRLNGFYSANSTSSPGTLYINQDGSFTDDFWSKCISDLTGSATLTVYVNGTQVSYKLTINASSGTGGTSALYYKIGDLGYYTDYLCEGSPVTKITRPTYAAKAFRGLFDNSSSSSSTGTQYVDKDGNFLEALTSLQLTANKTIYAWWTAGYKITVSANSGTGGTTSFYYDPLNSRFFIGTDFTSDPITSITPHTRTCYLMLGYMATNSDSGTLRVYADGTIVSGWAPTAATTIYCRWQVVSYKITLSPNSGSGGTDAIYYKAATSPKEFYSGDQCGASERITSVTVPTRDGYALKGIYSTTSSSVLYIDKDGGFTSTLESLSITANKTFYAQWKAVYTITLNKGSGSGGTEKLYYDSVNAIFYFDKALTEPATSLTDLPTQLCYDFTGYWSASSSGTQYIAADGSFTAALSSLSITANKTFYAQYSRVSYKITLNDSGGSGGSSYLFSDGTSSHYFLDDHCTQAASTVIVPTYAGYTFIGYYAYKSGGSKYIDAEGNIVSVAVISSDTTIYARWTANQYTLYFNYDGGTESTQSKTVTFNSAIGALPTSTKSRADFEGWTIDGKKITSTTRYTWPSDKTADAAWDYYFGNVVDYFALKSSALIPESSDSGDTYQHVCAYNATSEIPATETSGIWRNPTVTYRVVGQMTLAATIGKAYASEETDVSGFMIASVSVHTAIGQAPTVTVTGAANEGADAVQTYDVSVAISPRHRPQNLLGAISGGGELQELTLVARGDPVVVAENNMPCASDMTHGRIEATARTAAFNNETAPTAGTGFTKTADPQSNSGTDYKTFTVTVRKELV